MALLASSAAMQDPEGVRTITGKVQTRPGGERVEASIPIRTVPDDLPVVAASEAELAENDLVLGVALNGSALAFPIRYLGMYEVINQQFAGVSMAPTW